VQIGDENVHLVRCLLDEVFGGENFCSLISYSKTTTTTGRLLPGTNDYVLWYAKDADRVKYRDLYLQKAVGGAGGSKYDQVQLPDGSRRVLSGLERASPETLPADSRPFRLDNLTSPRIREARTGWDRTFHRLFRETGNKKGEYNPNTLDDGGYGIGHTFWGYWDGAYHILGIAGGVSEWLGAESRTFEGFQKLIEKNAVKRYCVHDAGIPDGSSYVFSEDRAWIMAIVSDNSHQKGDAKYWQWSKQGGWKEPVTIGTLTPPKADHLALVRHTRDIWYLYMVEGDYVYTTPECKSTLKYFKSTDGGRTWGPLQDTGLPAHTIRSHPSFARYGDNYYVFLSMDNNTVIYYSKDAEKWDKSNGRVVATGMSMKPHGTLLHQNALIFTVNPNRLYLEEQYGIITLIPELVSSPGVPTEPSPAKQAVLQAGTTETELTVKTHGRQTYDVAFYWDDGRYIGEDKLLREGDTARIRVAGLESGRTYRWYAVCRGALLEYYGCEPDTTNDEEWSEVFSFGITAHSRKS
jgi:hypothetical protein